MVAIFANTTSELAVEFVDCFQSEKLALLLIRVGQETGIEISRGKSSFSVTGHWGSLVKAHSSLEKILDDAQFADNQSDVINYRINESTKESTQTTVSDSGKRGRKAGSTVSVRQGTDSTGVPDPVVLFQYKENPMMKSDLMKPSNLLSAMDGKVDEVEPVDKTENSHNVTLEKTNHTENVAPVTEAHRVFEEKIENTTDNVHNIHEDNFDDDENTDIDEQYIVEVDDSEQSQEKLTVNNQLAIKIETDAVSTSRIGKKARKNSSPVNISDIDKDTEKCKQKNVRKSKKRISISKDKKENGTTVKVKTEKKEKQPRAKRKKQKSNLEKEDAEYRCTLCSYVGNKKVNLKEHTKRNHRNKFTCDQCGKQFGFNKDLTRHKKHVHSEPSHFCDVCNKFYKSKRVFEEHVLTHKENYVKPNFACKMCEKSFSTKYVLAAHIKAEHLGMKKSYLCPTCGRSFTQKNSYLMHANVHAGIKPYVCDVCGKAFTYDKSLREHKFMHDNIRRFQCHLCPKTFRQTTSLRIHMKVHKDTKDYMCTSCGKGFTQKQALIRHERIHSGDKPYMCGLCSRTFSDYSIIRRHMMLIHKKDPKDWRGDIISNLKRKQDYYIEGGPGHHVRELRKFDDIQPSEASYTEINTSLQDDKNVRQVDSNVTSDVHTNYDEEIIITVTKLPVDSASTNIVDQNTSSHDVIQDLTVPHNPVSLSQPVYPVTSSYNPSTESYHTPQNTINLATKASESDQSASPSVPINYSIPTNYSTSLPSSPAPVASVSEEALSSRYQMDGYRGSGPVRDMYPGGPGMSAISTMASLSEHIRGHVSLPPTTTPSGDTTQSGPVPNPWGSYLGYPAYYTPANYPHYQGPQN